MASNIKYFFIYHPALTYYSHDYNIQQIAFERDGKEPSAAYLKPIIEKARKDSIKVILYQRQLNPAIAKGIALDIGARAVEFDPLDEYVIENLLQVTDIITAQ